MSKVVFLLDDERSFADNRDAIVVRNNEEAIEAVDSLTEIDELWLDFMLGRDDVTVFLWHLVARHRAGNPVKVHRVIFHSSAYGARALVESIGSHAGFPEVEIPEFGKVTSKEITA